MALTDSKTGKIIRDYSIEELIETADLMRGYNLVALYAAGSGHAGGTLSIMDIAAALYLKVANHDPRNPDWADRDRIIWSTGHKAPSLYVALAFAGFTLPGTSALVEIAGSRGLDWIVGAGAEHCCRDGAGRAARTQVAQDLLHHGRWRAAGRTGVGSGHGGRALRTR